MCLACRLCLHVRPFRFNRWLSDSGGRRLYPEDWESLLDVVDKQRGDKDDT